MATFSDRVNAITVAVTSPDNNIRAVLRDYGDISVQFRPGSYRQYTERQLQEQVVKCARLIYTGYYRAYRQVAEEFGHKVKNGPEDATSPTERAFLKDRTTLAIVGADASKSVRIKAVGMFDWQCRIADGTVAKLAEPEFVNALQQAIRSFLQRHRNGMTKLELDHFAPDERDKMLAYLERKKQAAGAGTRSPGG